MPIIDSGLLFRYNSIRDLAVGALIYIMLDSLESSDEEFSLFGIHFMDFNLCHFFLDRLDVFAKLRGGLLRRHPTGLPMLLFLEEDILSFPFVQRNKL